MILVLNILSYKLQKVGNVHNKKCENRLCLTCWKCREKIKETHLQYEYKYCAMFELHWFNTYWVTDYTNRYILSKTDRAEGLLDMLLPLKTQQRHSTQIPGMAEVILIFSFCILISYWVKYPVFSMFDKKFMYCMTYRQKLLVLLQQYLPYQMLRPCTGKTWICDAWK